ncbi:hypothetical protein [Bacillus alkalicellulosilyticus]|uniref:hypothetical protein n=1 Tax=Alkalihalobacterium alkalicellulosilyticum TaxID=1912214 RepID=UPI00099841FF|nr:hypothetical protein [Bacillus alkalicellulosilyticus]
MKKKIPKSVIILSGFLVLLFILPFFLPNKPLEKLIEIEENVIEPHLQTMIEEDFEIIRVNVDRYQDTEDTRTYEVIIKFDSEPYTVGEETFDYITERYKFVIRDDKEVISAENLDADNTERILEQIGL